MHRGFANFKEFKISVYLEILYVIVSVTRKISVLSGSSLNSQYEVEKVHGRREHVVVVLCSCSQLMFSNRLLIILRAANDDSEALRTGRCYLTSL